VSISATVFTVGAGKVAATATNAIKNTVKITSQNIFVLMIRRYGINFVFTVCVFSLSSFKM